MKSLAAALALCPLLALATAPADRPLRDACASQHAPKVAVSGSNEFQFEYYKGSYRGEAKPGKKLACTEAQYTAYVASLDPAALMAANPTAAGAKPKAPTKPKAGDTPTP